MVSVNTGSQTWSKHNELQVSYLTQTLGRKAVGELASLSIKMSVGYHIMERDFCLEVNTTLLMCLKGKLTATLKW